MSRKQINLKLPTYAELDKFRGNNTFDKAIKELLRENGKSRKLELEVERMNQQLEDYRQQIAKDSSLQAPSTDGKVQSSIPMENIPNCFHRAIDFEKNKWYCEGKLLPKIVCTRRQQRFANTKAGCYPLHLAGHCKVCGVDIRRQYRYCYNCMQNRKERKEDTHSPDATKPFFGNIV